MRHARKSHADKKHLLQMMVRRLLTKFIDSFLAIFIDGSWWVVKILAGQTLSMYPNAMDLQHKQIHAEIRGNKLFQKQVEKHWTLVIDEVLQGKFY